MPSRLNREHTLPQIWREDYQEIFSAGVTNSRRCQILHLTFPGRPLTGIILGIAAQTVPLKPSDVLLLRQIHLALRNLEMEAISPTATRQIIPVSTFLRIAMVLWPSTDIQRNNFYNSSTLNTRPTTYQMTCRVCSLAGGNRMRQTGRQARGQEGKIAARIMRWVRTYVGNEMAQVFR